MVPILTAVLDSDRAAREAALLVPRADLGTLRVSGADRLEWLQGVLTSDVLGLSDGQAGWGLLLTKPGKILTDVIVLPAGDAVLLGIPAAVLARTREALGRFLVMEDAELSDESSAFVWSTLHGPLAPAAALRLAAGLRGFAGAVDWTGLGGAAVVTPRGSQAALEPAIGADSAIRTATEEDWLRLRVERLVPLYGTDATEQQNPHEASLDRRCVSWTKGCYLGQEAVCMQDMRGKVKRRLSVVVLQGDGVPPAGTPVTDSGGAIVGETRSAARSQILGGPATIALLASDASPVGTRLAVGGVPAVVVEPSR